MTREQNIGVIRKACIAANPEIRRIIQVVEVDENGQHPEINIDREIRLADVLLAIKDRFSVDGAGSFFELERVEDDDWVYSLQGSRWNLRKDDLQEQSDECIAFLAELLAK